MIAVTVEEICNDIDDDCDGVADAEFMTGLVYTDLHNCGSCGNDCANQGYLNATPSCDSTPPIPECSFSCDAGFIDANQLLKLAEPLKKSGYGLYLERLLD